MQYVVLTSTAPFMARTVETSEEGGMSTAMPIEGMWTDKKRYLWLLGIVVMGLPLYGYGLYRWTGLSLFFWTTPIIVYTLIPLLDRLIGEDDSNPPDEIMSSLAQDRYY